jgi:hypothetical protein
MHGHVLIHRELGANRQPHIATAVLLLDLGGAVEQPGQGGGEHDVGEGSTIMERWLS